MGTLQKRGFEEKHRDHEGRRDYAFGQIACPSLLSMIPNRCQVCPMAERELSPARDLNVCLH